MVARDSTPRGRHRHQCGRHFQPSLLEVKSMKNDYLAVQICAES